MNICELRGSIRPENVMFHVKRERNFHIVPIGQTAVDGSFGDVFDDQDTPIAMAAARASRVKHRRFEKLPHPRKRSIFTVSNQKGGVGKTTSTVNIAAALALYGMKVLVIDLDPQGNASTALGVDHYSGVSSSYDLLIGACSLKEAAQESESTPGLWCVPSTIDLAGAEIELVAITGRERCLTRAISEEELDEMGIDYVFIDCPPSLGLLTINAMTAATDVFIPIQCEYYALEGVGQLMNSIELIRTHLNSELSVSTILLTMYDGRTRLSEQVAGEVRKHFKDRVLKTIIPRSVKVSEAPGFGTTVIDFDPGSMGAQRYLEAARELVLRSVAGEAK